MKTILSIALLASALAAASPAVALPAAPAPAATQSAASGVVVGQVSKIDLDPKTFQSVVTLSIDGRYQDLSADTSAGIFTSGLLGESYIGLSPGGDPESLKPGDEIGYTQPAVDLMQLVGKYMFSSGDKASGDDAATQTPADPAALPAPEGQTP